MTSSRGDAPETATSLRNEFFDSVELALSVLKSPEVSRRWQSASVVQGFSIGGLAAHLYAGVRRLEVGLDQALPDSPKIVGLPAFYGANRISSPEDLARRFHTDICADAERRAEFGPKGVLSRFVDLVERLRDRLIAEAPDRLIPVVQVTDGVTPLRTYIASRIVELVVHSDDLASSIGMSSLIVPETSVSVVIDVCVELARARSGDLDVVRAFCRSERVPAEVLKVL